MSIPILMNAQQGEMEREADGREDGSDSWGYSYEGRINKKWQGKGAVFRWVKKKNPAKNQISFIKK